MYKYTLNERTDHEKTTPGRGGTHAEDEEAETESYTVEIMDTAGPVSLSVSICNLIQISTTAAI